MMVTKNTSIKPNVSNVLTDMICIQQLTNMLSYNIDNYCKVTTYYKSLVSHTANNHPLNKYLRDLHSIVCDSNNTSPCYKCKLAFISYGMSSNGKHTFMSYDSNKQCNKDIGPSFIYVLKSGLQVWFEINYKKIIFNHISHPELKNLIDNTSSYNELYTMFRNSNIFNVTNYNSIEFLMLIVFLGNNGIANNLVSNIN